MPQGTFGTYKLLVKDIYPHVVQQIISVRGIPAPTNSWCKATISANTTSHEEVTRRNYAFANVAIIPGHQEGLGSHHIFNITESHNGTKITFYGYNQRYHSRFK